MHCQSRRRFPANNGRGEPTSGGASATTVLTAPAPIVRKALSLHETTAKRHPAPNELRTKTALVERLGAASGAFNCSEHRAAHARSGYRDLSRLACGQIGLAAVRLAIGFAGHGGRAAEVNLRALGGAERPATHARAKPIQVNDALLLQLIGRRWPALGQLQAERLADNGVLGHAQATADFACADPLVPQCDEYCRPLRCPFSCHQLQAPPACDKDGYLLLRDHEDRKQERQYVTTLSSHSTRGIVAFAPMTRGRSRTVRQLPHHLPHRYPVAGKARAGSKNLTTSSAAVPRPGGPSNRHWPGRNLSEIDPYCFTAADLLLFCRSKKLLSGSGDSERFQFGVR